MKPIKGKECCRRASLKSLELRQSKIQGSNRAKLHFLQEYTAIPINIRTLFQYSYNFLKRNRILVFEY